MKRITPLLLLLLLATACSNDPQEPGRGTLPLPAVINPTLTIAGATTRTADDQGPVKTEFDGTETIDIMYYNGTVEKTLETKVSKIGTLELYINAEDPHVEATYTPADTDDSYADHLKAISTSEAGITYTDGTATITLTFRHTRCLVQMGTVTDPAGTELNTTGNVTIAYTGTGGEAGTRTLPAILPPDFTITEVTFTLAGNNKQYTAGLSPQTSSPAALEGGKKYPINITLTGDEATIEPTNPAGIADWNETEVSKAIPDGYDYAIYTKDDLIKFMEETNSTTEATREAALEAKVIQMANITLTAADAWTPIANSGATYFSGTYNGNGYTITGLTVDAPGDYAAMFSITNGATLTGIHLRKVDMTGDYAAALVIGAGGKTTISLCSATGQITGTYSAGGLVESLLSEATLLRSRANCTVTANGGTGTYAAGLVADNQGTILGCMAGGSVSGNASYYGGLVGRNYGTATIYHSYTTIAGFRLVWLTNNTTADKYIFSSYSTREVYNNEGAESTITETNTPGNAVRAGGHVVAGKTWYGNKIWTEGDYPTLVYSYAGE